MRLTTVAAASTLLAIAGCAHATSTHIPVLRAGSEVPANCQFIEAIVFETPLSPERLTEAERQLPRHERAPVLRGKLIEEARLHVKFNRADAMLIRKEDFDPLGDVVTQADIQFAVWFLECDGAISGL